MAVKKGMLGLTSTYSTSCLALQSNRKTLQAKLQERQAEVKSKAEQLAQEEKVAYPFQTVCSWQTCMGHL